MSATKKSSALNENSFQKRVCVGKRRTYNNFESVTKMISLPKAPWSSPRVAKKQGMSKSLFVEFFHLRRVFNKIACGIVFTLLNGFYH